MYPIFRFQTRYWKNYKMAIWFCATLGILNWENSTKYLKNAYFISRFRCDVTVYLNREAVDPSDLGRYLDKISKKFPTQIVDITVYLGKTKQKLRLIAYKVPPEIANERRRKARRVAACHNGGISEGRLKLCDYVILITNIPEEIVQAGMIGTIYRIRWTIELLFKTWKSQLNLQMSLTKGHK